MKKTRPFFTTGYKFIQAKGGISEYLLIKNGLSVLVMPDHSSPTATLMVTYRAGSRNEVTGNTGSTHILEHLMFKGSKKFNKKTKHNVWSLENLGARMNATTWLDRTNYYETVPIEHLDIAMQIEADRMRNAILRDEDLKTEMTVVRNEFERGENDPQELLDKEIWASAFTAHPYHHSTIGWKSDIENSNAQALQKFYDTFYHPNNATVTVIGDIEAGKVLAMVKKYFGAYQRSKNEIPEMHTKEPTQSGQRRVIVHRTSEPNTVALAWKIPKALHADAHAIQVLATILSSGKSSVLYRALVDHGFATAVRVSAFPTRDPGLFIIYVSLAPRVTHGEVEKLVHETIENLKPRRPNRKLGVEVPTEASGKGLDRASLARARKLLEAEVAFARDGSFALASYINEAIAIGDWTFFTTFMEKIQRVSEKDVLRVLEKYFVPEQSTVGHYISTVTTSHEK